MRVGDQFLSSSICIMEADDMQFLFGLDMLRRHQCQIDLVDNVLRFTGLGIALPFLQGADLPPAAQHQAEAGAYRNHRHVLCHQCSAKTEVKGWKLSVHVQVNLPADLHQRQEQVHQLPPQLAQQRRSVPARQHRVVPQLQ